VRRRLGALGLGLIAASLVVGFAPSTSALESEGFTISDDHMSVSKDYGPIALQNPSAQVKDPTLDDCKSLPSDAAIPIKFAIKSDVPTKAHFSVSWPAPPEANDLDIWFFTNEGDQISDSAGSTNPEAFNLGGLPNGTYWMCVRNFSGVNPGFTLAVEAKFLSLFERPPVPPTPKPSNAPPSKTATPDTSDDEIAPATPAVTPEDVATPGPDGATEEQELVAVSGNKQAGAADEGRSGLSVGLLALTGVIAAAGAGLVFVRIRRDTTFD
jgi:hypothetical protein